MAMYHRQTSAPAQPRFVSEMLVSSTPRRSGRNEELNSRLRMKADELERLFAEHKQRIHGVGRGDKANVEERPAAAAESWSPRGVVLEDGHEHSRRSEEGGRGEFYEKYVQKRDSKLREEWGVKKQERLTKMKAMLESLDASSAELNAQPRPSTTMIRDRDRLLLVRSSNLCEEEDDKQFSDSSSRSVSSKTPWPKRSTSSSTAAGRTSTGRASTSSSNRAIPRPSAKAPAPPAGSAARVSGSNLSDFRKETTKPSPQTNNFPRSKSTSAGSKLFKEEKPTVSTPSRKYSASPLKPLTLPKDHQSGSKPLLKKGPGARTPRLTKASTTPDFRDYSYSGKPSMPESPSGSPPRARARSSFSGFSGAAARGDGPAASPTGSTASWHPLGSRTRKKCVGCSDDDDDHGSSCEARSKDAGKQGIIRFLHFGRRTRGAAESGDSDWACAGAAGGRGRGRCSASSSSEGLRIKPALDYQFPSYDGFSDGAILLEQAQARGISTLTSPSNYKLKEDQSQRGASRSFFSLPTFRNRGGESKLGR